MSETPEEAAAAAVERDLPQPVTEVVTTPKEMEARSVTVEERQFGVDAGAREDFARLYDAEIKKLGRCPLKKIRPSEKKPDALCNARLLNFQQFLVHHQIHLLLMSDTRTQRQTNADARELVYPTSEKMVRAALGPQERQRMLKDPALRARLLRRRELSG